MVATNLVVNVANAVGDSPMDDEMLFHASLGGAGIIVWLPRPKLELLKSPHLS